MATIDTGNVFEDTVQNVVEILENNRGSLSLRDVHDTDVGQIAQFPCVAVEFDSSSEDVEEMGTTSGGTFKKRIDIMVAITYFHEEWEEKTRRREVRKALDEIANLLRKNWDVNGFCPRWGSSVDTVTAYIMATPGGQVIAGGQIMMTCSREHRVTLT